MQGSKRFTFVCSVLTGFLFLATVYDATVDVTDEFSSEDFTELYAWSNDADDGTSAFPNKKQHGVTKIISGCDADDPGCLYHMSPDFDYSQSYWTGPSANMNPQDASNEVYGVLPGSTSTSVVHHLAPEEKSEQEIEDDRKIRDLQDIQRNLEVQVIFLNKTSTLSYSIC